MIKILFIVKKSGRDSALIRQLKRIRSFIPLFSFRMKTLHFI